jgi:hypothetical protein
LTQLRIAWTGRLLQLIAHVRSEVFACLLLLCLWLLARVLLL